MWSSGEGLWSEHETSSQEDVHTRINSSGDLGKPCFALLWSFLCFPHLLFETRLRSKFKARLNYMRFYLKKPKGKGEGQDLTFLGMNGQKLGKIKYVTCLGYSSAGAA